MPDSADPPQPKLKELFVEFLDNLPRLEQESEGESPTSVTPALPASFLSLLSPLLRARLAFNIQNFEFGDAAGSENYQNDRVLETVRHQWAELLSWSTAPVSELGPIIARKLYESKSILAGDTASDKIETKGYARPDVETLLASAWLPETSIEIIWCWDPTEAAWRVHEVKLAIIDSDSSGYGDLDYLKSTSRGHVWSEDMAGAEVAVAGLNLDGDDDDDDSYWNEYDNVDDEKDSRPNRESTPKDDDEYYKQYDSVVTAVPGDAAVPDINSEPHIHTHIRDSVRLLLNLARGAGISQETFLSLVKEGLQTE